MQNFTIHVVEAKNLKNKGTIRTSDPYCKIIVNNERIRTKTKRNTVNPRFDQKFHFNNVPIDGPVSIEIYDKNMFSSNKFMAKVHTDVSKLKSYQKSWWPLYGREGEMTQGSVYLECFFIENYNNII